MNQRRPTDIGIAGPQHLLVDPRGALEQAQGLAVRTLCGQDCGQRVQAPCDRDVIRTVRALGNRERALRQRLCCGVIAEFAPIDRQVFQRNPQARICRAEGPFGQRQQSFVQYRGAGRITSQFTQHDCRARQEH